MPDDNVKIFKESDFDSRSQVAENFDNRDSEEQLAAARQLGYEIAQNFVTAQSDVNLGSFDGYDVPRQARLLNVFAISVALNQYCLNAQIASTAMNSFYNTLKLVDSEFYDDIGSTGSLSFYYLAKDAFDDIVRRIGQTFAMLCSKDGDAVLQELGEALYCKYVNSVQVMVGDFGLKKKK